MRALPRYPSLYQIGGEGRAGDGAHRVRRDQGRDRQGATGKLTGLLAKIRPAVEAARYQGERSAKNDDFVDTLARNNVELTMVDIRRRSAVLADLETSGAIKIVGAMYNLETGLVEFFG